MICRFALCLSCRFFGRFSGLFSGLFFCLFSCLFSCLSFLSCLSCEASHNNHNWVSPQWTWAGPEFLAGSDRQRPRRQRSGVGRLENGRVGAVVDRPAHRRAGRSGAAGGAESPDHFQPSDRRRRWVHACNVKVLDALYWTGVEYPLSIASTLIQPASAGTRWTTPSHHVGAWRSARSTHHRPSARRRSRSCCGVDCRW